MEQRGAFTPAAPADAPVVSGEDLTAAPIRSGRRRPEAPKRRRRLALDLTLLGIVGALLLVAIAAGSAAIYREFYSPTAFVQRYLGLLESGHAADALAIPGVAVDSAELEAAGLPANASEALLRPAALGALTDVSFVSEEIAADGTTMVGVTYRAGAYSGTTTFAVQRTGSIGLAPTWSFARSPLALMDLSVSGSMTFDVNGFTIDKRQVSPDGVDADPEAAVALLVFSPGLYSVSVDTPISTSPGVAVLSDSPLANVPVSVQALPTPEFVGVVQQRVEEFLTTCATQEVLQPTACPFGFSVQDRVVSVPTWSIAQQPVVAVQPDGAGWRIPDAEAIAHIQVDIRSLFDGSVDSVSEDVPFIVSGAIEILPDGTASIVVRGTDTQ